MVLDVCGGEREPCAIRGGDMYHLGWQSVIGGAGQQSAGWGWDACALGRAGAVEWGHAKGLEGTLKRTAAGF